MAQRNPTAPVCPSAAGRLAQPTVAFPAPPAGAAAHPGGAGRFSQPTVAFDAQLAAAAAAAHAVFSLEELVAFGLGPAAIRKRCAARRLHRLHRGVYAVIPPDLLTTRGWYRAATLAAAGSLHPAGVSHRSGAAFHGLRACHRATVEVVVPGVSPHRHDGVQVHRALHLDPTRDLMTLDGIVVTTVSRTLLDLAAVIGRRALERAADEAEVLRRFDLVALEDQLSRNPGHPGAATLGAVLRRRTAGETATDSELEEAMLAVVRTVRAPAPELHGAIDPGDGGPLIRPDFVWRRHRLAVEVDGARSHLTRHAFEDDRRRDQRLTAAGWRVVRITWRQLRDDPRGIAELLAGLLRAADGFGFGVGV